VVLAMTESTAIAIVSGASGGIGKYVAQLLYEQGYQLFLIDINEQGLAELSARYPNAQTRALDLTDAEALEALCQEIENLDEELALAFINAGRVIPAKVLNLNRSELQREIDLNLKSTMTLNHACGIKMREQGRGQIVTTVSMAALVALPGSAAYSASKFGLRGFLIAFRAELEPYGVSVSMLLPSAIDTPMLRFEALNRGSALNFISKPAHVEVVGAVFKKAQKTKKLEYYIPYRDSIFGRLVCSFPAMLTFMYPLLSSLGERGRKQFIKANHLD
jgi:hypothetical protein